MLLENHLCRHCLVLRCVVIATWLIALSLPATCQAARYQTVPSSDSTSETDEPPEGFDTLVICPQAFQATLQKWVRYRSQQGYRITVQTPRRSSFLIKKQILETSVTHNLKHILLVGDAEDERTAEDIKVATGLVRASDTHLLPPTQLAIASDNFYADLDDDDVPDLSIGRIPVDSAQELNSFIERVIAYEQQGVPVDSLRRVNFIAGVGNFGKVIDSVIEETTKQIITDLIPGKIQTSMTYGSWSSPYCPDPRQFASSAIERFNEGCLFWVYIGHGGPLGLDRVSVPGGTFRILDITNVNQLASHQGAPIALFLACYSNATDFKRDGLGERMLKQPGGPIATIGGSRITKPAAMALLSLSMMHEYFHGSLPTLGEVFLKAKQDMIQGGTSYPKYREMIEGLARTFNPQAGFKNEKRDHAHLLQLLGDPLLKLTRPKSISLGDRFTVQADSTFKLSGKVPVDGKLTLELSYRRNRLKQRFQTRKEFDASDESLRQYQQTYDQARDLVLSEVTLDVTKGYFEAEIEVPEKARGECVILASLDSASGPALGSVPVAITKKPNVNKD